MDDLFRHEMTSLKRVLHDARQDGDKATLRRLRHEYRQAHQWSTQFFYLEKRKRHLLAAARISLFCEIFFAHPNSLYSHSVDTMRDRHLEQAQFADDQLRHMVGKAVRPHSHLGLVTYVSNFIERSVQRIQNRLPIPKSYCFGRFGNRTAPNTHTLLATLGLRYNLAEQIVRMEEPNALA